MKRLLIAAAVWLAAALPTTSWAQRAPGACAGHFPSGHVPAASDPADPVPWASNGNEGAVRLLCFESFAVLHSGATRTPLYAAQHLKAVELTAIAPPRIKAFHVETRLPADERAQIADYVGGQYDRGHMAAEGDMRTPNAVRESFSLANIAPQEPTLNRGSWAQLEARVRQEAMRRGELFVFTGPIFEQPALFLRKRVRIPVEFFKIVYDPTRDESFTVIARNRRPLGMRTATLNEVETATGLSFFETRPKHELSAAKAQERFRHAP